MSCFTHQHTTAKNHPNTTTGRNLPFAAPALKPVVLLDWHLRLDA